MKIDFNDIIPYVGQCECVSFRLVRIFTVRLVGSLQVVCMYGMCLCLRNAHRCRVFVVA